MMDQAENLRRLVQQQHVQFAGGAITHLGEAGHPTRILAVTSGKGGVGKTNLTLNLALTLAREHHKKVLVLDADFGTANVDIIMGIFPKYNISHLFFDHKSLDEIIIEAPFQVKILPGVSGVANLTALTEAQKARFFDEIESYQIRHKLDYILIDTGAGVGTNVINFLLASDEIIVIVTPEPTSLSDAYATIKVVHQYDPDLKVGVLVNLVSGEAGAKKVFETLHKVTERFLGKELQYLGFLRFDKHMPFAVRAQKPLVLSYPNSEGSLEILRLADTLVNRDLSGKRSMKSFFELAGRYFGWNHD